MNSCDWDPLALTTLVNTLAAAFAETLDDEELALWPAVLTQTGDVLATIAVQRTLRKRRGSAAEQQ